MLQTMFFTLATVMAMPNVPPSTCSPAWATTFCDVGCNNDLANKCRGAVINSKNIHDTCLSAPEEARDRIDAACDKCNTQYCK